MSGDITPGAKVTLHGLQSRPELNGTTGVVKRWVKEQSRWRVNYEVEGEDGLESKAVTVKPENLIAEPIDLVSSSEDEAERDEAGPSSAPPPPEEEEHEELPEDEDELSSVASLVLTAWSLSVLDRRKAGLACAWHLPTATGHSSRSTRTSRRRSRRLRRCESA